jgi:hypothetical protein
MFIREDSDLWQPNVGAKPKEENKMHPEFLWIQELMNWLSHSKTQTPLKSDPLWLECYVIDADEELFGNADAQTFMVTADSFFSLMKTLKICVQQTNSCPRINHQHRINTVMYNSSGSEVLHVESIMIKQHKMR